MNIPARIHDAEQRRTRNFNDDTWGDPTGWPIRYSLRQLLANAAIAASRLSTPFLIAPLMVRGIVGVATPLKKSRQRL
jgi:hypothetical protein